MKKQLYALDDQAVLPINNKNQYYDHQKSNPKFAVLRGAVTVLTILTLIPLLYYPLLSYHSNLLLSNPSSSSSSSSSFSNLINSSSSPDLLLTTSTSSPSSSIQDDAVQNSVSNVGSNDKCDLFAGKWVWEPESAPYYTNTTCTAIHEHQNCMKYGKPDLDFTKWRWRPDECVLPLFDPEKFLEIVRGKSLGFVGDSIARNQMQSLICLISKVDYPVEVSDASKLQTKTWFYSNYNFTLSIFWSPYLVKTKEATPNSGRFNLYLDEVDPEWITHAHNYDYLIISAGQWFFRPSMFYENNTDLVGCLYCKDDINCTHFGVTYGYGRAFETTFKAINNLADFKGITFLRTISPSHFENGLWDEGGNCIRTRPFMHNETSLNGENLDMYTTQIEELKVAERDAVEKNADGLKRFRLLDTSKAMWLRPDGHPNNHWHGPEDTSAYNDCVHWCLPGPIDAWNDFLLEILKRES
ncbi:hypothetical protein C5167_033525 [Papaver somniferum]|uniref:Uncharacterized protein n=1 Tax=Papaver somniferum TaxID=3469 RepID=A0A4Y7KBY9_PAPSO|nr:protein trichome birefringence-like 19 [Papaver somniferum]RZC70336.1 hypothetical protein C5167_033525 [Papaver somniferum]